MMGDFSRPLPETQAEIEALLAEGWTLVFPFDEPGRMEPPKRIADAMGLRLFVEEIKREALADSLDAAWAEAVAASRERGLTIMEVTQVESEDYLRDGWRASAARCQGPHQLVDSWIWGDGPDPVAALRALTAKLRGGE